MNRYASMFFFHQFSNTDIVCVCVWGGGGGGGGGVGVRIRPCKEEGSTLREKNLYLGQQILFLKR